MTTHRLDTSDLLPGERVDAVLEAILHATVPCAISLEDSVDFHARLDYRTLGPAANVYRHEGSGLRLTRGAGQLRAAAPDLVALAIQTGGRGHYRQDGAEQTVDRDGLMLIDLTAPYEYWWSGEGGSFAVQVEHQRLGLPVETIRRAGHRLNRNPVIYDLVRSHVTRLRQDIDAIDANSAPAALVGSATAALVRALIIAGAGDPLPPDEHRLPQLRSWILDHLGDSDLTPERIAAAHGVSVRTLYNIWRHPSLTLTQWIIHERLEAARRELAAPGNVTRPISTIARRWGFTDVTHFSHRFKNAYGLTARDWRRMHVS